MDVQRAPGKALAEAFHLPDAHMLSIRTLHKSTLCVTELAGARNHGTISSIPKDDAYNVTLNLLDCPDQDLWLDDKHIQLQNFMAGNTCIFDLRKKQRIDLRDMFHVLVFYLPRRALRAFGEDEGTRCSDELNNQMATGVDDAVIRHLLLSMLPALKHPEEVSATFVDHLALALIAHVAYAYGGARVVQRPARGRLAVWQERRAKELLKENLSGQMTLERLAAECGLSASHFARAFRQTTGVPPHRWLQQCRLDLARELLRNRSLSLSDVALTCGFADQSHFTRVFAAAIGMSPGVWRRTQP